MPVGLLLITHGCAGDSLLAAASGMLSELPLRSVALSISQSIDPETTLQEARKLRDAVEGGDGVLVLTDMYGSTPSNIANRLLPDSKLRVVSGINLPMLIRVLNYPDLELGDLADKAVSGGRDGVLLCDGR
jgi:mannose PTS system EIIA component